MRIGTDGSLTVCKNDGYLMMDYKTKELFPKGVFDPNAQVRFMAHYPDYILKEMKDSGNWFVGQSTLMTDTSLSANNLWEIYLRHKDGIDSCSGTSYEFPKDEYEMLTLADSINPYCGLD